MLLNEAAVFENSALKQKTSIIHSVLCTCTFMQHGETDVYLLTLRGFRN
jgi:hypothetical protein